MTQHQRRPWKNPEVPRKTFEEIVQEIFQEYKDNMLISKDIADEIMKRISEEILRQVDFTDSYYHTPARFVAMKASPVIEITPESLASRKIGVVSVTAFGPIPTRCL